MAEGTGLEDDYMWSPNTCKLTEVIDDIPCLVRVTEGIYSCNDAGTFSQGDIIKLDACKPLTRVSAFLSKQGSKTRYEKYGNEISLPYHYNGRVHVMPMHGEYHRYTSVTELIEYFPRHVRVLGRIDFTEPSGKSRSLQSGDHLELKAVRRSKNNAIGSLRCSWNGEDMILPRTLTGVFQVLPDDKEQTIREVVETYKLPQCVRFLGSGIQEIMSKDIQEAIDNLKSFSGEMILTGKNETSSVLFGHYKGMQGADTSSRFCRRSAIVIPLDTPEISEIDVQLPTYMDPDDYELFLLKNFSESSATPEVLEGALYVEFTKTSRVQFLSSTASPAIPPRKKPGQSDTENAPPRMPKPQKAVPDIAPRPGKVSALPKQPVLPVHSQPYHRVSATSLRTPSPPAASPSSPTATDAGDGLDLTISDVFTGGWPQSEPDDIYEPTEEPPKGLELPTVDKQKHSPKIFKVIGGFAKKVYEMKILPEKKPVSTTSQEEDIVYEGEGEEGDQQVEYDYIDDITLFAQRAAVKKAGEMKGKDLSKGPLGTVKPIQRVMPNTCRDNTSDGGSENSRPQKQLEKLSISELESVLMSCGMPDLAKVCNKECVDGNCFASLTTPILKKKPFHLSDFHITKVEKIKSGWRPKT